MATELPSGIELMEQFVRHSPFSQHVGIEARTIEPDHVELALPFRDDVVTIGDTVHGGAISTLIDMAATAASWTNHEITGAPVGSTVALTVNFVRAARGSEVTAAARVVKRGRSLCFCDVAVTDAAGELVATGLVTYKLGG
jgi:uncharacterized protein (TIGR00369 family)